MRARVIPWTAVVTCLFSLPLCLAENVLFEDDFEDGLSRKWPRPLSSGPFLRGKVSELLPLRYSRE